VTSPGLAIRLENCAKTFPDGTRALIACSLDISPGETVALLGPSGCGKTTLLRIIAGLDFPDPGGRVFFGDVDVTSLPVERRGIGMVFQSYALFPNMSVRENIEYGLKVRRVTPAERLHRVDEMLAMMRIEILGDRRIDQLSGTLLLDEPLTALDARLRDDLRIEIDRLLRALGITAIYVTHDQAEAMALADRIAVMNAGQIEQVGSPRQIYAAPATAFVTGFIGTMNRIDGQIHQNRFSFSRGSVPVDAPDGLACLLFRPEDIHLVANEAAQFVAEIESCLYFGDHLRVTLTLGAEHTAIIARVASHLHVEPGMTTGCSITASTLQRLD
jgi:putative spermidine/putrescine transport system ATP-binding protein